MSALPTWVCSGGSNITNDICVPKHGDGVVLVGIEECDDGNILSNDGCSSIGLIEQGFNCSG